MKLAGYANEIRDLAFDLAGREGRYREKAAGKRMAGDSTEADRLDGLAVKVHAAVDKLIAAAIDLSEGATNGR